VSTIRGRSGNSLFTEEKTSYFVPALRGQCDRMVTRRGHQRSNLVNTTKIDCARKQQSRTCFSNAGAKSVKIIYKAIDKIHQAREPRSDRIKIGAIFVGWLGISGSNAPSEPRPQGLLSK
jgi:hypothetical protein